MVPRMMGPIVERLQRVAGARGFRLEASLCRIRAGRRLSTTVDGVDFECAILAERACARPLVRRGAPMPTRLRRTAAPIVPGEPGFGLAAGAATAEVSRGADAETCRR